MMRLLVAIILSLLPGVALAQPTLDSLWPNADGTRWDYRMSIENIFDPPTGPTDVALQLSGTVETAGGTAQVLIGTTGPAPEAAGLDPILRAVWRARPDLRPAIEARYGKNTSGATSWAPMLLHDGYFMKTAVSIQMWEPDWTHATWTYLHNDLRVGATFTHQLVPELADNVFLHGTVEAIDATVQTVAGTFEHAVRMRYVVDYGWSEGTDDQGNFIGRFRSETRGHVHYVPGFGPVDMLEDFVPLEETDCAPNPCPPDWTSLLGVSVQTITLSLTHTTVAVAPRSWSQVKGLYRLAFMRGR